MLRQADDYINQVSQTERMWLHSGSQDRADILLLAAPSWLGNLSGEEKSAKFDELAPQLNEFTASGIGGLFLGQISEPQDAYLSAKVQEDGPASSLEISTALGGQQGFERLLAGAEAAGLQLGADLPGATTERGPDFILQARHATGYAGLYAMLPVPRNLWNLLPPASSEWDCAPLSQEQVLALSNTGIMPQTLAQDKMPGHTDSGWACTGEIKGADGLPRRWIYRFAGKSFNPVLLWQDPSGLTRKILSAAIIARTGICGISLAGLRLASFMGLEPADNANGLEKSSYGPGLDALKDMASQIRRYGGWSLQAECVEEKLLRAALEANCDFSRDDVSGALFRLAQFSGNAVPLANLLRARKKDSIAEKRLARGFPSSPEQDEWLLAALDGGGVLAEQYNKLRFSASAGKENLLEWNAGLPGLLFLNCSNYKKANPASSLSATRPENIKSLLLLRKKYGLAAASIESIVATDASVGVLSALPGGAYWLLAVNFGSQTEKLPFSLSESCARFIDAASGNSLSTGLEMNGKAGLLTIPAHTVKNILCLK